MSEATHPDDHKKILFEAIEGVIYERRNWPWPANVGREDRREVVAEIRAEAARAAVLPHVRERAARLAEKLEAAKLELGRAGAEADQAAGAVRGVMLAGGDVDAAEKLRDDLATKVERLRVRVADLGAARTDAEAAVKAAEQTSVHVAARKRLEAAESRHDAAKAAVDALHERFVAELARTLLEETEARLMLNDIRSEAGHASTMPENAGDYEPVPEPVAVG